MDDTAGIKILQKALKHAAQHTIPFDSRERYLSENADYGENVYRVTDVESINCWYGFIYTRNDSQYMLAETIRPNLNGLEVNWPTIEGEDIELRIPPKSDNIIILRRNGDQCSYGLAYRTHQRAYDDFEMIQLAKDSEEPSMFGDSTAFFKLYNDQYGAVFYIDNQEKLPMETTFDLDMDNMMIKGEAED